MDNVLTLNGNMLTFGGNAITVVDTGIVTIGGKNYTSAVMPDGHRWLTLNLDLAWDGLSVDSPLPTTSAGIETPAAAHYDYDDVTYGWGGTKYGLFYNYGARIYLYQHAATLIPGWHVATSTELTDLASLLADQYGYGAGLKTKSTTGWKDNGNGNGNTPMDIRPHGRFVGGAFEKAGELAWLGVFNGDPEYHDVGYGMWEYNSSRITRGSISVYDAVPLRLVEDYV